MENTTGSGTPCNIILPPFIGTCTAYIGGSTRWNFCPQCGKKLEVDWNHCPGCGTAIGTLGMPLFQSQQWTPTDPQLPITGGMSTGGTS